MHLQGPDLPALMKAARVAVSEIPKAIPNTHPQPLPVARDRPARAAAGPDEWRISRAGLTAAGWPSALRAFTGGLWAGEYFDGNERLDIIVKGNEWRSAQELAELPIVTPGAGVQTVGELAQIRQTVGPSQLLRIDGKRTVRVNFEPPAT